MLYYTTWSIFAQVSMREPRRGEAAGANFIIHMYVWKRVFLVTGDGCAKIILYALRAFRIYNTFGGRVCVMWLLGAGEQKKRSISRGANIGCDWKRACAVL